MLTAEKKKEKVALARAHKDADRLVAGFFTSSESNRGCSVGCDAYDIRSIQGHDWNLEEGPDNVHAYVADYFGTPEWLEHLRDAVFEALPNSERADWHVSISEALPVGVNFQPIEHKILRDVLRDIAAKAVGEGEEDWRIKCKAAVDSVAALHEKAITKAVDDGEWDAARAAARAALAALAAGAAAWDAALAAGVAGAALAAGDAGDAVRAARVAAAGAAGAAGDAAWKEISEIVLKHLREAGATP